MRQALPLGEQKWWYTYQLSPLTNSTVLPPYLTKLCISLNLNVGHSIVPDLTHRFIQLGHFVPIHTYASHKIGSKQFSWPKRFREKCEIWREHWKDLSGIFGNDGVIASLSDSSVKINGTLEIKLVTSKIKTHDQYKLWYVSITHY